MHPSVSVRERYCILTMLLRNKQFAANWTVQNISTGLSSTIGNLTIVAPQLLTAWKSARILIAPPASNECAEYFESSIRSHCYDFGGVEMARLEVQRMALTHSPDTQFSITVNLGPSIKTTTDDLSKSLDRALLLWSDSTTSAYEQPIVSITVYPNDPNPPDDWTLAEDPTKMCLPPNLQIKVSDASSADETQSKVEQPTEKKSGPAKCRIRYIAPPDCERQNEIQTIYRTQSVYKMLEDIHAFRSALSSKNTLSNNNRISGAQSGGGPASDSKIVPPPLPTCPPPRLYTTQSPSLGDISREQELNDLRDLVRRQSLELALLAQHCNSSSDAPMKSGLPNPKQKVSHSLFAT